MKILILCTGNSCRSQMAEGLLQSLDSRLEVHSAGTDPSSQVNPNAVRVMEEIAIDISGGSPKKVDSFLDQTIDCVITVCGDAEENCPVFSGRVGRRMHIGFPDPANAPGPDEEVLGVFRECRDDITRRFTELYEKELKPKLDSQR
jgi:arsenate reductase